MIESDPAQLHQIIRFEPDRKPAMIERLVAEISDPKAGDLQPMLVGIERADRFPEHLADAVPAVRTRGHVGPYPVMAGIEAYRMVRRRKHDPFDALFARG